MLAQHTHTVQRVISNFSPACGRRLRYRRFSLFFYRLRPIDLQTARRVLIEASGRNEKGEVKSRHGVAFSLRHPSPPQIAPRGAAHTQKKERPQACENISPQTLLYVGDSRLVFNYAFNILSEESSPMCLIKAFPWGSTRIML